MTKGGKNILQNNDNPKKPCIRYKRKCGDKMKIDEIKNKIKKLLTNSLKRGGNTVNYIQAKELLKENPRGILLDVRSKQEYDEYHLQGAMNIPLYELDKIINQVAPSYDTILIVYCQSGARSTKAIKRLKQLGYLNIYEIAGGIDNL